MPSELQIPELKRLVILGAGAVGASLAGLLHQSGFPVVLIARGEHGRVLRESGLCLRMPHQTLRLKLDCYAHPEEVPWQPGDVAMLATKLQDARGALNDLQAAAGRLMPVVCAVNGLHGERWAAERFETVLSMLVWVLATHLVPGEVRLHSSGPLGVLDTGPHQGAQALTLSAALAGRLRAAGFDAIVRPDILLWKRAKWISNIGGAAQALIRDDWQSVVRAARSEAQEILDAAGIERIPREQFLKRVEHVRAEEIDGHAREGGSSWQSHARGQPMETPWIEGALVALAAQHGLRAPINARLEEAAQTQRAWTAAEILGPGAGGEVH